MILNLSNVGTVDYLHYGTARNSTPHIDIYFFHDPGSLRLDTTAGSDLPAGRPPCKYLLVYACICLCLTKSAHVPHEGAP